MNTSMAKRSMLEGRRTKHKSRVPKLTLPTASGNVDGRERSMGRKRRREDKGGAIQYSSRKESSQRKPEEFLSSVAGDKQGTLCHQIGGKA